MEHNANVLIAPLHDEADAAKEIGTGLVHVAQDGWELIVPANDFSIVG